MEDRLIRCVCSSNEHIGIFSWFSDEKKDRNVYLSIHLSKLPFFQRVKNGLKYIFGYRCKYGDFEEIILDKTHISTLKEVLSYLEENDENKE